MELQSKGVQLFRETVWENFFLPVQQEQKDKHIGEYWHFETFTFQFNLIDDWGVYDDETKDGIPIIGFSLFFK